jgi:hypothetical protein
MGRLPEIGSRDHKLRTTHIQRSLYNLVEVIVMGLFPMVHASKDWIAEVDTNLVEVVSFIPDEVHGLSAHQRI